MSGTPDPVADLAARHRLARRLDRAVCALPDPATPLVVVDLDAFDANAADLVARAGGTPVRLASKSVRVPALLSRALARPGFRGVLAYSLREALWLAEERISDDIVLGYPSVDRVALRRLAGDAALRARVTLMVDDVAQLDVLEACRTGPEPVKVALDVDAGLWLGSGRRGGGLRVGPKRSPLRDPAGVVALARTALDRGLVVDGVMTYEGQVAGVPDQVPDQRARSFAVRRLKAATLPQLAERRAAIAAALADLVELRFWNGGGSGSVETTVADPVVTEVAAGSGLLVPTLFDHYRSFAPRPAAYFGIPVLRRPAPGVVTVAGGGFVASGPAGADRLPVPWAPPGLALTGLEGAGEVQTPLTGPGAGRLAIGDRVWFRHAKAGELAEHANVVHLLAGDRVADTVPTYRGLGHAW
jgi:D-serine deaminase-like pyridoxal phosphate-dependent protein